ncbi:hypothetical protein MRB53_031990 [Persea americana]|uniref:Uncharacterized protein n=1 Tax=Persea americana TaxID=3435 RepID=A0ACC2KQP4_PERAE|nr:hypothetical protein MRB53_031990 [Persea americana]
MQKPEILILMKVVQADGILSPFTAAAAYDKVEGLRAGIGALHGDLLDFWVVKNVSGRILVGLRWWNEINEQGESVWKFECLDQESLARMNKKDSWIFWWTLYLAVSTLIC